MYIYDTIIIGAGQAGLSVSYFLRRKSLDYLILDARGRVGFASVTIYGIGKTARRTVKEIEHYFDSGN